jgi:hypothetical protein
MSPNRCKGCLQSIQQGGTDGPQVHRGVLACRQRSLILHSRRRDEPDSLFPGSGVYCIPNAHPGADFNITKGKTGDEHWADGDHRSGSGVHRGRRRRGRDLDCEGRAEEPKVSGGVREPGVGSGRDAHIRPPARRFSTSRPPADSPLLTRSACLTYPVTVGAARRFRRPVPSFPPAAIPLIGGTGRPVYSPQRRDHIER